MTLLLFFLLLVSVAPLHSAPIAGCPEDKYYPNTSQSLAGMIPFNVAEPLYMCDSSVGYDWVQSQVDAAAGYVFVEVLIDLDTKNKP